MPTHRRLAGGTIAGLLLAVLLAACSVIGPHLHVDIDNTGGPAEVTVTVDSTGPGMTGGESVKVPSGQGAAWGVPLGARWEVRVDGRHVAGSDDRAALPSSAPWQDVLVSLRVNADGSVTLLDAH